MHVLFGSVTGTPLVYTGPPITHAVWRRNFCSLFLSVVAHTCQIWASHMHASPAQGILYSRRHAMHGSWYFRSCSAWVLAGKRAILFFHGQVPGAPCSGAHVCLRVERAADKVCDDTAQHHKCIKKPSFPGTAVCKEQGHQGYLYRADPNRPSPFELVVHTKVAVPGKDGFLMHLWCCAVSSNTSSAARSTCRHT